MKKNSISLEVEIPEPLHKALCQFLERRKLSFSDYLTFALIETLMKSVEKPNPLITALYLNSCLSLSITEDFAE